MIIGVPRETHRHEHRVALTPSAVARLIKWGHAVVVEKNAGVCAHFADRHYEEAGAQIVYSSEEAYLRADLVCRVGAISGDELDLLRPGSTICSWHHLAVARRPQVERLMELGLTLIGYEVIRDAEGDLPVLLPFSEMGGQLAVHIAAHRLQTENGGRGILLGNVPGVPPPTVLVLGAGTAGSSAARQAVAAGTHVIVVDSELDQLRRLSRQVAGHVVTDLSRFARLERYSAIADVIIGAVLVPGSRCPTLITEEMVKAMKPGSVIVDLSIDQGGCVETSRPTTLENPTFTVHDVVHYCVPNMTANIPRTASRAQANASLPYLQALADQGIAQALRADPGLAAGVYLYRGKMVNALVGETLGVEVANLEALLAEDEGS